MFLLRIRGISKGHRYILLSSRCSPFGKKSGLKDTDLRYRQRYVVLIVIPEVRRVIKRSKIISSYADFGWQRIHWVDYPILNTILVGATLARLRRISTHWILIVSAHRTDVSQRLIVGGFFEGDEMGRLFRRRHGSQAHSGVYHYRSCISLCHYNDIWIHRTAFQILRKRSAWYTELTYQGTPGFFGRKWRRRRWPNYQRR
jgi:lysyl-tRNA synthetase class 2